MKLARCQFHARCPYHNCIKIIRLFSNARFSTTPCSLLPTPCSLLPVPCSLLPTPYSLLPTPCSHQSYIDISNEKSIYSLRSSNY
ncbi:MAG: hypothetical protein F6J98_23320 [Moorea sp. SIO4G2]|uniref:hypothetical protein n=1 Tax=unclassified Moorena TaxID=2683338 RepID=UPI0013F6A9A8|nr:MULTISPECIES: hypothetical protein [unclassified Moorena]NEO12177.1 hypothetical protein [Moorena sp. SIO3E8]NEO63208.1 hypothetical protein [Moorena sp. SIO4G2]NEQ00909.1 hypothetical protein [Moorena sp. SIO3F7]